MDPAPQGVLLINLGTPDAPETGPVRRYLREFLSDPRVLDISPVGRAALLYGVVLPFRPAKSAEAYRKIWMKEGSPLLVHGQALAQRLQDALGPGWAVELGMRYGNPPLRSAIERLRARGIRELTVVPLYPQYASSSTGSSLELVYRLVGEAWNVETLRVLPPFYDRPAFLDAFADVARPVLAEARPDHVLFSFHGLPERQVKKSDLTGAHCLARADCCDVQVPANRWCYRMQCFFTARAVAQRLALDPARWTVTFQSRLGRTPWIKPYTDLVIPELARGGAKRLAVFCPAFVADCLETLEEIGIRA
ncbi:MAG: ferrochelatase, partial [Myxococcaceae bacterium]